MKTVPKRKKKMQKSPAEFRVDTGGGCARNGDGRCSGGARIKGHESSAGRKEVRQRPAEEEFSQKNTIPQKIGGWVNTGVVSR